MFGIHGLLITFEDHRDTPSTSGVNVDDTTISHNWLASLSSSPALVHSSPTSVAILYTVTTFSSTKIFASGQVLPRERTHPTLPVKSDRRKKNSNWQKNRIQYDPENLHSVLCGGPG